MVGISDICRVYTVLTTWCVKTVTFKWIFFGVRNLKLYIKPPSIPGICLSCATCCCFCAVLGSSLKLYVIKSFTLWSSFFFTVLRPNFLNSFGGLTAEFLVAVFFKLCSMLFLICDSLKNNDVKNFVIVEKQIDFCKRKLFLACAHFFSRFYLTGYCAKMLSDTP